MIDPLSDIQQYSEALTISQVLKFCEKKDIGITRGMIQNYIRDGLLPSPVNKRFYTHKYLAALVLIDRLKTVFDIPSIKKALTPFMDEEGLPLDVYKKMMSGANALLRQINTGAPDTARGYIILMTLLALAKAEVLESLA